MSAIELRKNLIRRRIRDRVKNVRDRYFNNYVVIEPGTRFSEGGPLDEDTFALSKYKPPNPQPNTRKYSSKKEIPKINIKPRRDFSHLEKLVSDYLLYKHNKGVKPPGDADDRSFNAMTNSGTAKKSSYASPYENARSVHQAKLESPQTPNIRKLRYGVQGFNHNKAPYIQNYNDDRDQLSSDLYNLEQKSEDITYNGDINEMYRSNTRKAADNIPRVRAYTYSNSLMPTKQIRNDNVMGIINPINYASDGNEDAPSDIDYNHRTVEAQKELNWQVPRNQNTPRTRTYAPSNSDYYRHYENDRGYKTTERGKPRSMLMNLADDNVYFNNDDIHAGHFRHGYSGGHTSPYGYEKNELRDYYFNLLKRARPFKRPNSSITGFGQPSELRRRTDSASDEDEDQRPRYFVPDRASIVRGY